MYGKGQRRADGGVLKEILTEYEEGAPFSFYFGAPCHSLSLKVFYVFERTVTRIDAPIICTYLEYMRKDMSPFNFDSDRICSLD